MRKTAVAVAPVLALAAGVAEARKKGDFFIQGAS